jgi:pimeloyl-ACP methyl ester carboxylesterase
VRQDRGVPDLHLHPHLHSNLQPHLTRRHARAPRGLVLMLHGGAEADLEPVGSRSRPWLRSRLMMEQLHRPFRAAGLDVWLLRYRITGWNHGHAEHPSPVPDARWALDQVRAAHGNIPVVLLGHSMGARTAVAVADDDLVRGVVGLAPWFPADEPVDPLRGKRLVALHGRGDRVTAFTATAAFVRRAATVASSATLADMRELDHYMLRGIGRWNEQARERTLELFG